MIKRALKKFEKFRNTKLMRKLQRTKGSEGMGESEGGGVETKGRKSWKQTTLVNAAGGKREERGFENAESSAP